MWHSILDIDEVNACVSAPDYKYCTVCCKQGYKNTKEAREIYRKVARFEEYIFNWQLESEQPKEDVDFIFNKCMQMVKEYQEFGKVINTVSIFNQAKEILSYVKEDKTLKN